MLQLTWAVNGAIHRTFKKRTRDWMKALAVFLVGLSASVCGNTDTQVELWLRDKRKTKQKKSIRL